MGSRDAFGCLAGRFWPAGQGLLDTALQILTCVRNGGHRCASQRAGLHFHGSELHIDGFVGRTHPHRLQEDRIIKSQSIHKSIYTHVRYFTAAVSEHFFGGGYFSDPGSILRTLAYE